MLNFFDDIIDNRKYYLALGILFFIGIGLMLFLGGFIDAEAMSADFLNESSFNFFILSDGIDLYGTVNFLVLSIISDILIDWFFKLLFIYVGKKDPDDFGSQRFIAVLLMPWKCIAMVLMSMFIVLPNFTDAYNGIWYYLGSLNGNFFVGMLAIMCLIWTARLIGVFAIYLLEYLISSVILSFVATFLIELLREKKGSLPGFVSNIFDDSLGYFIIIMAIYYLVGAFFRFKSIEKIQDKMVGFAKREGLVMIKDALCFTGIAWLIFGGFLDFTVYNNMTLSEAFPKFFCFRRNLLGKKVFDFKATINNIIATAICNLITAVPFIVFLFSVHLAAAHVLSTWQISLAVILACYILGLFFRALFYGVYTQIMYNPGDGCMRCIANAHRHIMAAGKSYYETGFGRFKRCFGNVSGLMYDLFKYDFVLIISTVGYFPWEHDKYVKYRAKFNIKFY